MNKHHFYIGFSNYQGYLNILIDSKGKIIVYDDAGLSQWEKPEQALEDNKDENTIYKFAKWDQTPAARPATWDEIKAAGWDKYVINKPE